MEKYNIIVIGGGSGGLMVAAGAAGLGARVALVEQHKMGGDCLNTGCVPSKALISAARRVALLRRGADGGALSFGNTAPSGATAPGDTPPEATAPEAIAPEAIASGRAAVAWSSVAWPSVRASVQGAIDAIAPHDSVERFTGLGVDVLLGRGWLSGARRVEVALSGGGSRTLEGKAVVIATGSTPAVPPVPGLEEAGYITNEEVFTLAEQPRRLLVMGGGAIGTELGQCFARLGSQVTLVELLPGILPREDAEAAEVVAGALRDDGIELLTGHAVVRVEQRGGEKLVTCRPQQGNGAERTLAVDEILVATGRKLNVEGLGLEEAGVVHDRGGIRVNARMRTNIPSIYACGDVVGAQLFTHTAGQQGRVIIQNALMPFKTRMDNRVLPSCTFTDPELARVGLIEAEAKEQGLPHRVIQLPFSGNDRAICDGDTRGFLKILTPPGKDVILGATLVGAHAGEIIHEIVLAMQAGRGLNAIAGMVHIYPTRSEILRRAADEARRDGFTPRMQRMLRAYLGWRRR